LNDEFVQPVLWRNRLTPLPTIHCAHMTCPVPLFFARFQPMTVNTRSSSIAIRDNSPRSDRNHTMSTSHEHATPQWKRPCARMFLSPSAIEMDQRTVSGMDDPTHGSRSRTTHASSALSVICPRLLRTSAAAQTLSRQAARMASARHRALARLAPIAGGRRTPQDPLFSPYAAEAPAMAGARSGAGQRSRATHLTLPTACLGITRPFCIVPARRARSVLAHALSDQCIVIDMRRYHP
jgi:hypothetical protein